MTDDVLADYVLNQLDPADRAAVESHLAARPDDLVRVARLRAALKPLDADRDGFDPPPGLAIATIARTAEYVVAHAFARPVADKTIESPMPSRKAPAELDPVYPGWGWRRFDLLVAASVAFLAFGLVIAGIGKLRHEREVLACQNRLRELHASLVGYADTHGGRYPQVGTAQVPTAGAFVPELNRAGQYPDVTAACPVAVPEPLDDPDRDPDVVRVGYTYTLGYVGPQGVIGVRRNDSPIGTADWVPVSADLPPTQTAAGPHGRGQNVLYAGGSVRYSTTTAAGWNGDDIYINDAGLRRAGLHAYDACLGSPRDYP
jgi:hypothetical protein